MHDSDKILIMANYILQELGEEYRCDDMSDYRAPVEFGRCFTKLGFAIYDDNKNVTIDYYGLCVYDKMRNKLLPNLGDVKGWMDDLYQIYNDIPAAKRRIGEIEQQAKEIKNFCVKYLSRIPSDKWFSDNVQYIQYSSDESDYEHYDNYKVYEDKQLVLHFRDKGYRRGEVFFYKPGAWEDVIKNYNEYYIDEVTKEKLKKRDELDSFLSHFHTYTLGNIKEDTWVSDYTLVTIEATKEEPGEKYIVNYKAYTNGELMFHYKATSPYCGRCLQYIPGRWMDDINNYFKAYQCGNVPEKIQEKNIAYKERKRILNGENKNYY